MKIILSDFDAKRIEQLNVTMQRNGAIFEAIANFVSNNEKLVTPEMLQQFVDEYEMEPALAYAMLVASACGLSIYDNPTHKEVFNDYFVPAIRKLDSSDYANDLYVKTIKFPEKTFKNWKFTYSKYAPCEAFVYNNPRVTSDFREIPQVGFFDSEFSFPAVLENGREWMSVKPNEIETMQKPIENARGKVLAYGLGLGYFAFMASMKSTVDSVTVVEKSADIIELFSQEILPQFPNKQKIKIIQADAYEYAQQAAPGENFDYIFSDIWHDTGDGLSMYLKLRRLNSLSESSSSDYWIEDALLSSLRYTVFNQLYKVFRADNSGDALPNEKVIRTYQEFVNMISDKGLKELKVKV